MSPYKHILIIRLSALGDVAMTIPVIRVLVNTYPELKITVLTRPGFAELFSEFNSVDVLEADVDGKHRRIADLVGLGQRARRMGIDCAADLHNVIRSKILTSYLKIKKIKTATLDKGRSEKKALTSGNKAHFSQLKSTHERYAEVFSQLGFSIDLSKHVYPPKRQIPPAARGLIGNFDGKLIGIAPYAAYSGKTYPKALMEIVLKNLDAMANVKLILFGGGKNEIDQLEQLAKKFGNIVNVAGAMSLKDERALIDNLDLMVSMDSANGHLAALSGVPVVTLWGVTHPYAGFKPFGQPDDRQLTPDLEKFPLIPTSVYGNRYPASYENAMETINPDEVLKKILEVSGYTSS